jgi:polyisoprenoid-binding protein YceI
MQRRTSLALALLALAACSKKKDEPKPKEGAPAPAPAPAPVPVATPAPAPDGDYVEALVSHAQAKPTDPVHVRFSGFKVVSADFDPKNLEGGKAELEIDLASLDSGNGMRDEHLKGASYFDVAQFGKANVKVHDVKKGAAEGHYSAQADVSVHGVSVTWPVEFQASPVDGGVRVTGEHKLLRSDFKVGTTPEGGDTTSEDVLFRLQVTLRKT